ncbi:MAG: MotA/TolQ/ExbB proton channel family protein [Planctomycetes bacterium]|nr:MotA/TolQ/ExbB proton channel family protein [Planctomycetota bacterium]
MLEILRKGGPAMVPLLLCSVLVLATAIERSVVLWRVRRSVRDFAARVRAAFAEAASPSASGGAGVGGAVAVATPGTIGSTLLRLCKEADNPLSRVLRKGLARVGQPYGDVRQAMEEAAGLELPALEARLPVLSTIAQIGTLLGLLGTVFGMIRVFADLQDLTQSGQPVSAGTVAGGIAEALIATAGGLCVAIPALVLFQIFSHAVNGILAAMEAEAVSVAEAIAARAAIATSTMTARVAARPAAAAAPAPVQAARPATAPAPAPAPSAAAPPSPSASPAAPVAPVAPAVPAPAPPAPTPAAVSPASAPPATPAEGMA